ncbi:MAG TPA: branched-chain amino acid ABC transporter permease [Clostridiales bacterium]|nr:branched-chain amino acid ABC transporter permease [Clostridiales bacterium]
MSFLSQLINGLSVGSIYALIALGYTMVYGIAKMLNFAHGDVIMVGAYTIFTAVSMLGLDYWIAIILSVVFCTVLGIVIEKIAYKPLRKASPLTVLITAIGVSYLLQNIVLLIYGSHQRPFPKIISVKSIKIGENLVISGEAFFTMVITIVIMIILTLFIKNSKTGRAMVAVSEDKGAAELMGINVNRIISITFAIGSGLAAIAGLFFASTYGFIGPYSGAMPGIKAFIAAVLGGIGSIPGAMLGGILLGVVEGLSKAYISTELSDAIVFSILIVILLFKPSGLLGKNVTEKV